MKTLNVIIIDDEPKCVDLLSIMLQEYHTDICILATANSMQSGLQAIEANKDSLHILFLDIEMPGGDGFTLLQHIPQINFRIIFTTAYDQFAIKAIKFSALDYLLKPIDHNELVLALKKYRDSKDLRLIYPGNDFKQALQQKTVFKKLAVATHTEIVFIPLEQIIYMESDNNYTTIYIENKQRFVSSKNIGYYEDLLDAHDFLRISNSFLVNLKKVERFIKGKTGTIALENGQTLQVSASKKEKLLRLLGGN